MEAMGPLAKRGSIRLIAVPIKLRKQPPVVEYPRQIADQGGMAGGSLDCSHPSDVVGLLVRPPADDAVLGFDSHSHRHPR